MFSFTKVALAATLVMSLSAIGFAGGACCGGGAAKAAKAKKAGDCAVKDGATTATAKAESKITAKADIK